MMTAFVNATFLLNELTSPPWWCQNEQCGIHLIRLGPAAYQFAGDNVGQQKSPAALFRPSVEIRTFCRQIASGLASGHHPRYSETHLYLLNLSHAAE